MYEWLSETFSLLFSGANLLIEAALRLFVLALGLFAAFAYFRALYLYPIATVRSTLGLLLFLLISYGSILFLPKYLGVSDDYLLFFWVGGCLLAYFIGGSVAGLRGENKNEASEK